MKEKVLILCTGNSCRSQMAEGILRHYGHERYEVFSAGSIPSRVNPLAIQVMQEIGIDISTHRSKHLDEYKTIAMDYVITVCDNANSNCPYFPKTVKRLHWPFPDPPHQAEASPAVLNEFRIVRDMILIKFKRAGLEGISSEGAI